MGLLGSPNAGSFFFAPEPAKGFALEGLTLNVLRSLQFSYMMMKGFRSTTRSLKAMEFFQDGTRGSSGWRPGGTVGGGKAGRIGTAGSSGDRVRVGRPLGGRCPGGLRNGRGAGRRARCTGDNRDNIAPGKGTVKGHGAAANTSKGIRTNGAGKGAAGGDIVEGKGSKKTPGGNGDGKFGEVDIAGNPTNKTNPQGTNGPFVREGSPACGMEIGGSTDPAVGFVVSHGMTNRTLSVAGLGMVDGISNQLKPMKGFMKSVKMATGVVSGMKTATGVIQKFQAPAAGVVIGFGAANGVVLGFETARMIVKAGKISKDFASVWKSARTQMGAITKADINPAVGKARTERLWKGLKASDGALSLVKLTKEFGGALGGSLQDGFTNWDLVSKSYDASNSILKVFEAVLGFKGYGVAGVVGKGFTALKGAVSGLGLSAKAVKVVMVSKEISIVLLKGFGISKTAIEAFKATKEGKKMLKWFISKEDPVDEDLMNSSSTTSLKGRPDAMTFKLLMTCAQQSAACRKDTSPSLIYSLACLLLARFKAIDTEDPDENEAISSSRQPGSIWRTPEHHSNSFEKRHRGHTNLLDGGSRRVNKMQRREPSPMIPCIKPFADLLEKSNHEVKETQEEEPQSGEARNPKQQTKIDLDEQGKSYIVQDEHAEKPQSSQEQNPKQQTTSDVDEPVANEAVDFLPFRRSVVETDTSLE